MQTSRSRRLLSGIRRIVLRLGLAFAGFSLALVLAYRWLDPPTSAFMLQAKARGVPVVRTWVPLESVSPLLQLAVIAGEDQRFPEHHGFDTRAITSAIQERLDGGRLRGASTITQQTAKNLFLWPGRSFLRKGLEAWFALLIDAAWPKERILEVYLNVAEFGEGIYGAHAAARLYFGKKPSALTPEQAALLAAVLPNPRAFDVTSPGQAVLERRDWILGQMRQLGGQRYLERL